MDQSQFARYLRQPELLDELPTRDLTDLVEAYPYAATVRLLVYLKARRTNDPDAERLLARFSASTPDRVHLFDRLATEDAPLSEDEVLELRALEELDLLPADTGFDRMPSRLNVVEVESIRPVPPPVIRTPIVTPTPASRPRHGNVEWVATAAAYHELLSAASAATRVARPEDPDRFAALLTPLYGARGLADRLRALRDRSVGPSSDPAPSSVRDHSAVVSETLADLLSQQGKYGQAIRMYRRLVLLYPEKKTIFAGLIEELKLKM